MPKYEIEIPDGVLPEGTVPVAYRKPRPEDHYLSSVNSQHVCHAPKGKFCEKEAFLIVEKRPAPKFKVGDKVIVGNYAKTTATIHSVGSNADGPYYLQYPNGNISVLKWYENELKLYTEPQKPKFQPGDQVCFPADAMDYPFIVTVVDEKGPKYTIRSSRTGWTYSHINESSIKPYTESPKPAQYQIGQKVTYQFGLYPEQQWVIRSFHRSSPGNNNVYKIAPVRPGHPVLNAEIFVDESDLSPYVEKPHPKFKVGDWISHTDKFMLGRVNSIRWDDTWGNWRYNCDGMPHAAGWPEEALRQTTRVPLTQDDAVKLALGAITPKDIQLEDKRFEASLAHCQAKQLGRNEAGPTLWLKDPKEVWDTAYPISDLTRLV